ncbi:HAD family hydrolase [Halopseudomonas pachastrellae]|nr:HAD family hydrolase [Halopseudomonas pachastrellae]
MIQLVTFDLDNTLWETESVVANAERVLADWLGKQAPNYAAPAIRTRARRCWQRCWMVTRRCATG